jgi:hypothetical protein
MATLIDAARQIVGAVLTAGSYVNPSWLTSLAWSKITGAPTTLSGYGITDASTTAQMNAAINAAVVGLLDDRGNYSASGNTFPATGGSGTSGAILKGDLWTISVAGTLGGTAVSVGDVVRALVDTPGQTSTNWAIAENNIGYVPVNQGGSYADPSWITSLAYAKITGAPTVLTENLTKITVTAGQTSIPLGATPASASKVLLYVNNAVYYPLGTTPAFTVSGSTLTWSNANAFTLAATDDVVAHFWS